MLGFNDDYTFHEAFTATAIPKRNYRSNLDLGCGLKKSTWPLRRAYPHAEVMGQDLAAPCLRKACDRANTQGLAITFRQGDSQATGLSDGHFDLVTSTMLIYECRDLR